LTPFAAVMTKYAQPHASTLRNEHVYGSDFN
jgi:hypothetical protein